MRKDYLNVSKADLAQNMIDDFFLTLVFRRPFHRLWVLISIKKRCAKRGALQLYHT